MAPPHDRPTSSRTRLLSRVARPCLLLGLASVLTIAGLLKLGSGVSLEQTSAASVTAAYPLKASANHRYLVDQNGQPFFIDGDAAWSLIAHLSDGDKDTYLANRQAHGVNMVIVNLIEHLYATNAPKDVYGNAPFTGKTFTTPNDAYFQHADYAINDAASKGIVVLLDPLYLGSNCDNEGWCTEVEAASTSDMQSWGQYVGNRYKNDNNIVWVIGGDMDPSTVKTQVSAFVQGLTSVDSRHLITAHNAHDEMAVSPWVGASWLTLNAIYTYNPNYEQGQNAWNVSPTLPFFQIESTYENEHSSTQQQLRAEHYWAVLSGGGGYIAGNCPIWGFGDGLLGNFCPSAGLNWQGWLNSPGAANMQRIAGLFTSVAWWNLVPDWSHAVVTSGYGTYGSTNYVTAERSSDGSLVVAYLPVAGTVGVNMAQLSGAVTAEWYDPTSGTYTSISGSPFTNTGTRQFTTPGNNAAGDADWVLLLQTSGSAAVPTNTPTPTPTAVPPTPIPNSTPASGPDLALSATASASSQNTSTGQTAAKAIDGVIGGFPSNTTAEWATVGGTAGSWLKLTWTSPQTLSRVVLYDRPNLSDQITGGNIQFSDGSSIPVGTLNNDGTGVTIDFPARTVTSLQFNITSVSSTTKNVGLSEIQLYNLSGSTATATPTPTSATTDVALSATATASSQNTSTGQTAAKAIDGVVAGYPSDTAAEWATVNGGAGSWLKLTWSSAHTVSRIVLYDRPNLSDQVTGGTIQFSDGTSITVGPLNNDGSAVTLTFPSKTITSLQFNVTSVSSTTKNVGLAEIQVY